MTVDLGGEGPCLLGLVDDHRDARLAVDARQDLATPAAIHDLVTRFYREIVFDDLLAPIFDEVAEVDWTIHIPNLIDYWCWIILGPPRYPGTVTATHRRLHAQQAITPAACDRWFTLWSAAVDESWAGPGADRAKAHSAALMAGMAKHVFGFEWCPPVDAAGRPSAD